MNGRTTGWALIFGLAAVVMIASGCSTGAGSASSSPAGPSRSSEPTSGAEMDLRIGRTTQLNTVTYALTGPNGFATSGTLDARNKREVEGTIPSIPVGGPYAITLTAASTDKNTTCSGTRSNITVSCPGTRERDEDVVTLTCTRNHVGREWGDRDWRSNAKTLFLYAELHLACQQPDACARMSMAQACGVHNCGLAPDGCGGTYDCGICAGSNPSCSTDGGTPGQCGCVPLTAPQACGINNCGNAPDGCGGTVACGTCTGTTTCDATGQCTGGCPTACPPGENCGTLTTVVNGVTCPPIACGTCTASQTCHVTSGGAGSCGCAPLTPAQACGSNTCGTVSDGCGGLLSCGTCNAPSTCSGTVGTCLCIPRTVAQACGTQTCGTAPDGCGGTINCGVCPLPNSCNAQSGCGNCECVPLTQAQACRGSTCGTVGDGCGCPIDCGTCTSSASCTTNDAGVNTCTPGACIPKTPAQACGDVDNCGNPSDGCGGTVRCGVCTSPFTCSNITGGAGFCVCTPRTTAAACGANDCGTVSDGCGGTINCGTCAAPQACNAAPGGAGQCGCVVTGNDCGTKVCGAGTDTCGNAVSCGMCARGSVCNASGQCIPVEDPCGPQHTTQTCLDAQGSDCLACATANGCLDPLQNGGTCEGTPGTLTHFAGTLGDGTTCASVFSPAETEAQICMQTLDAVFTSGCAASLQQTPCVCGATDPAQCLMGTATPTGPLYDLYQCDFDTTDINSLQAQFTVQATGAGQANALIQCAAAFGCGCF